jgi:hypothetical protein
MESPPERHVDGEKALKPVDLQPKKRMNQNSHPQRRRGNHSDSDEARTETSRQSHERGTIAPENPTTEKPPAEETPKLEDPRE